MVREGGPTDPEGRLTDRGGSETPEGIVPRTRVPPPFAPKAVSNIKVEGTP